MPVRLRSAAEGLVLTGVKVGIWGEGAGVDLLDFDPKQMARTPLFVVEFADADHDQKPLSFAASWLRAAP